MNWLASSMFNQTKLQNAVGAIRVSTPRQGTEGDSPEAQKEQIERFALNKGFKIKKIFLFLESASKEQQPMQEAINYCKDPKHNVQLFIVKSIDRFTRGGSYSYSSLKMQLELCNVRLVDIYGIIGSQKVNTLEHLGVSYKWSVYDPTKTSEILEAERASDEKRDIMSRMIGAQIRYTRLGYLMRKPPYGYMGEKIETRNGLRNILIPHPTESLMIKKIYELRCLNTLDDKQIATIVNNLGFKTRVNYIRSTQNRSKIIGKKGGNILTVKNLQAIVKKPIYAGILCERWTDYKPISLSFEGLVSINIFNKANRGQKTIIEENGILEIKTKATTNHLMLKSTKNLLYPYRRVVLCPICEQILSGSASRGRNKKHYPAYHCDRKHYFRIPIKMFNQTIESFIDNIRISPDYINSIVDTVISIWIVRQQQLQEDEVIRKSQIAELESEADMIMNNLQFLKSEKTINYMETRILSIDKKIESIKAENVNKSDNKFNNLKHITSSTLTILNNINEFLFDQVDPLTKSSRFSVLFEKAPTYDDILQSVESKINVSKLSKMFQVA